MQDQNKEAPTAPQWRYKADDADQPLAAEPPARPAPAEPVSWTATEFIAHQKNLNWYVALGVVTAVAFLAVFLLTQDIISAGMLVIVAVAFAIFAARQPRVLDYRLDEVGLTIGGKFYPYLDFKSFAVVEEGAFNSIVLLPLKRFMPLISVYYAPQDESRIVDLLSGRLPLEERRQDTVDRLMRKIRF